MPWCTRADLETRFGADEIAQLADRDGGGVDASIIDRAIEDASAEIDGYLAARYTLPLPVTPPVLVRIACDVARYRLWEDRASDTVRQRYEDARRLLEGIAKGTVSLGIPATNPNDQPVPSLAGISTGSPRVFGRTNTEGY